MLSYNATAEDNRKWGISCQTSSLEVLCQFIQTLRLVDNHESTQAQILMDVAVE